MVLEYTVNDWGMILIIDQHKMFCLLLKILSKELLI